MPIIALIIGSALGLFYFGGLWLTVQQLPVTKHPYRLIFFSFIFRLGITLFILSLILSGNNIYNVIPLLTCCLGFLAVRTIMILFIQSRSKAIP
ncbi:ATP synthase subunit I [Pleurocapsa sp. PCC 7319]|uniref:ATP synthase subunit I n=1 Tax=Pleurocapsa sp. PCC 7319 TaxID=118161 RepID=UPI000344E767|nr:ATP synthase subunit I [Pleurocapsa sp. PCC 7319]